MILDETCYSNPPPPSSRFLDEQRVCAASEHRQRCSKNLHEEGGGETMQQTARNKGKRREKGERERERKKGYRRNCADITSAPKNFPRNYALSIRSRGWKQTVPPRVKERERFLKAERKETWKGGFSTLLVSCYNLPESMQRSLFSPFPLPVKMASTIRCNPSCEISCQAWLRFQFISN